MSETPLLGRGRAPGKVILFGEHAVVYGRPALAVPVTQVWAEATVAPAAAGTGVTIVAADLGEEVALRAAPADHPLAAAVRLALAAASGQASGSRSQLPASGFQLPTSEPDWRITVRSTIPVASGLGSGAAVTAAIVRAVAEAATDDRRPPTDDRRPTTDDRRRMTDDRRPTTDDRRPPTDDRRPMADDRRPPTDDRRPMADDRRPTTDDRRPTTDDRRPTTDDRRPTTDDRQLTTGDEYPKSIGGQRSAVSGQHSILSAAEVSTLVYEIERLHHGTPSGIDNTVIAYGQPVYFVRGRPPQPFAIGRPFTLAIADTGIRSPTRIAVGDVRAGWQREPVRFEALFDQVAGIVEAARAAIAAGEPTAMGPLMNENHAQLQELGVSCRELDALVAAARAAGALGAKLSGAGRGGNMIALVTEETAPQVTAALTAAGAVGVIVTQVGMTADR